MHASLTKDAREKHETAMQQMQETIESLKDMHGTEFEEAFINAMIEHHSSGISMAKYANQHAHHDKVRELANHEIESQSKDISSMHEMALKWEYTLQAENPAMSEQMTAALEGQKDQEFDEIFMTTMRMHHQTGVAMSELVDSRAEHSELKQLALHIISEQKDEIAQFEALAAEWNLDLSMD